MNSSGIRWGALIILGVSFLGFIFGGRLPIPLMGKFFLGAFGFGTGVVLLIVAKILRVREYEGQGNPHMSEGPEDSGQDEE